MEPCSRPFISTTVTVLSGSPTTCPAQVLAPLRWRLTPVEARAQRDARADLDVELVGGQGRHVGARGARLQGVEPGADHGGHPRAGVGRHEQRGHG